MERLDWFQRESLITNVSGIFHEMKLLLEIFFKDDYAYEIQFQLNSI